MVFFYNLYQILFYINFIDNIFFYHLKQQYKNLNGFYLHNIDSDYITQNKYNIGLFNINNDLILEHTINNSKIIYDLFNNT